MVDNSPSAPVEIAAPAAPSYRLHDYRSVGVATLLGSPLAGSILMALNYRRVGKAAAAAGIFGFGLAITCLLVLIAFNAPSGAAQGLGLAAFFGMMYGARWLQGTAVEQHLQAGGRLASRWKAAGAGLSNLAVVLLVVWAIVWNGSPHSKIYIGADQVYYTGSATEQDAKAVGASLKTMGYFQGRGVTAMVSKDKQGYAVSFTVRDGIWNDNERVSQFEAVGHALAPAVGGPPFRLRFMDTAMEMKKEVTIQ